MPYFYSRNLKIPFDEAVQKAIESLQQQGFGIITTIDLKETLKQKLNVDFRQYRILGACNAQFAYKAISLESHIGLILPCNVVVQEHENGEIEVSAINPLETLDKTTSTPQLTAMAEKINDSLRAALDNLHRAKTQPNQPDALPTERQSEMVTPVHG